MSLSGDPDTPNAFGKCEEKPTAAHGDLLQDVTHTDTKAHPWSLHDEHPQLVESAAMVRKQRATALGQTSRGVSSSLDVSKQTSRGVSSSLDVSKQTSRGVSSSLDVSKQTSRGVSSSLDVSKQTSRGVSSSLDVSKQTSRGVSSSLDVSKQTSRGDSSSLEVSKQVYSSSLEGQESVATTEARLRMEGVELKEEWQDEDFPRPLPEEEDLNEELFTSEQPTAQSYGICRPPKKKLMAPDISLTLDQSEDSFRSDELDVDIDTPSDNSNEFDWEDDLPKPRATELLHKGVEVFQEYSASEEKQEGRRWRIFRIGEQDHRVDMKAIEPYKRVISHGGYYGDGLNAIIVFAVCFMPERNQPNYRYIMDNLFKYVIGTLELLVAENYMIVYLNGATSRRKMPSVSWLRKCYQQIDRRLRKNLKSLIIVHPSWFIRTLLAITKPFISSKFSQKIKFVFSLADLAELVPMEYVSIPECIKQYDAEKNEKKQKRIDQNVNGKGEAAATPGMESE